jgi:hypothetical protein
MRICTAICLASTFLLPPLPARGEVLQLRSGGQVEGTILNPDESPRTKYVIETASGARVSLGADQVKHVIRRSPDQEEYARIRPTYPDTAEGHWALAQWCTERRLFNEREHHLEKVIDHDATHVEARRLLGYQLQDGQWKTQADIMQARGYVYYEGDWRTPQDVSLRERKKKREAAELDWSNNLRRAHKALTGSDAARAVEAREQILAAKDAYAAPALVELLDREQLQPIRKLLVDALAGNKSSTATAALMERAIKDPNREIHERAIDALLERKHPDMVRQLAKALESNDNVEVNRAAALLAALGYETAISPLIDALVTTHKQQISANQNQFNAGIGSRGGGLSVGGGGPKVVRFPLQNPEVLSALVKLSGGQNFDYDARAWRAWYANTLRVEDVNIRRD